MSERIGKILCRLGKHRPRLTGEVDGAMWLARCERCGLEGYGTIGTFG